MRGLEREGSVNRDAVRHGAETRFAAMRQKTRIHLRPMPRQVKRYGSRKLYDSAESRYVSLQEVASWITAGEEVEVVDNASGEDVTVQVLTQVISEQGRRGSSFPSGLLHDLIRVGEGALQAGEEAVSSRVKQVQQAVGSVATSVTGAVQKRAKPSPATPAVEDEMARLRERLDALEARLAPPDDES